MTPQEAKKMLKAKLECLKRETSGTDIDCNYRNCDECNLCYEQGNMGEQKEALAMAIKALEQTRWIPVTKRLPNEFADVLCNTDSEEIFIATYLGKMNDETDCFDDNDGMMWEGNVIAWMPLPQPYKEGE